MEAIVASEIDCVVLGQLSVPGMRIKVRWFPGGMRKRERWRVPSNILTFSRVRGEPNLVRNVVDEPSEFRPAAPLMFWPRSTVWESLRRGSQLLTVSSYFDGDFPEPDGETELKGISIEDFSMLEMMQLLHDEVRMPGPASDDLVRAIGCALRIKLNRWAHPSVSTARQRVQSRDIAMVDNVMQTNGANVPKVSDLAALCNTNRRSLLRRMRMATGKTTSRYLAEAKLNRAKMLLAMSQMSLQRVAHEAGYSTASHFSSRFKSMTGMSPSAFRRKARRHEGSFP
jgi:AraC family transcriptional regulator